MVGWINEAPTEAQDYEIKKVAGPEKSLINVFDLMWSMERIGELMLAERDYTKAKKLEVIYKDLNEVIQKGYEQRH